MLMIHALLKPEKPVSLSFFRKCLGHVLALQAAIPPQEADPDGPPADPVHGHIFPEAAGIVMAVQHQMTAAPRLFDPKRAAGLLTRQARAFGWLSLADGLQLLADRAAAHHRREQAGVTREALGILRRAREAARLPDATAEDRERHDALSLAEGLVHRWSARKFRHKK